jgi:non-ribosomal peptide synthetase component E (peptide arylation enzyme)
MGLVCLFSPVPKMDLEQQLQILVNNAPQDGVTPRVIEQGVTPVLKVFAQQLQHLEYYVIQTLDQGWVLTTLSNRATPNLAKKVIYAFSTLKDAHNFQGKSNPNVIAVLIPVTHILFQLFAMKQVDSIVFMEVPGDLATGKEVLCSDLQKLVNHQLQQFQNRLNYIPPNLA